MRRLGFLLTAVIFLSLPHQSCSHWWFMSQVYALGAKVMCNSIAGLVTIQRQICRENPDVMISVGKGAKLGIHECQYQFLYQRWNCSTAERDASLFGKVMRRASKETAFVYSISTAGVVHEVTRSCSLGELKECSCDNRRGRSRKGFEWGGCSDNIMYGLNFAKAFVDSREVERDARALMNLHNNYVGRRAVKTNMLLDCKCHGVSGSCSVRTCWKTLPPFRIVGEYLKHKYMTSQRVTVDQSGKALTRADIIYSRPSRDELVYLEESPDYCDIDAKTGSLGTSGRECNKTSTGTGGCKVLCCGKGFNTIQVEEEYKCSCKFHWCCHVKCQKCRRTVDKHICKGAKDIPANVKKGSSRTNSKKNRRKNKKRKDRRKDSGTPGVR
ncbi:protein Wnt-2b-A-like [Actinia tenebrosa]|uniref:Protein Wnt n=1 Tax=Actinia tenebrosa TaxID=6105 RepID=A0A6P8IUW1_ACTTE|nr:protein Wnt-2b-A-like [Actinia tenebrosa]